MSHPEANLSNDRRGRFVTLMMLSAAAIAAAIWIGTGAVHWRGYPSDYSGGRIIAAALGILAQVVLLAIGLTAIRRQSPSWRWLILAIACWSAARLVTASLYPLGSDEAYHWQWARRLDWCFYDHPGMVAWLARLSAPFGGEATAAVRLSGVVLGSLMPLATAYLAWIVVRDSDVAIRSALVFMLTPILSGSVFLMPALPVLFFWLLAIIQFWRAMQSNRLRDWLLVGAVYGAALNCNFTTFLFPFCALVYLAASPAHRRHLAQPGPYLAIAVAAVCFLPVILWNTEHQWRTFGFNFFKRHRGLSFHPDQFGLYVGQLLLYISPVMAIGLIVAGVTNARRGLREKKAGPTYLAAMGLGPILAFMATSFALKARAHYAAPAFVPLIILFVHTCRSGVWSRWFRPAVIVGLAMTMGFWWVLLLTALVPAPTMNSVFAKMGAEDPDKPTAELYGWPALGSYLDSFGERLDAKSPTVVIALSYAQASLAMHYSRNLEYAFTLDQGRSPYGQQFNLWGPLEQIPIGCDAVLFRAGRWPDEGAYQKELAKHFDRIDRVATSAAGLEPTLRYFTIWKGYGYRGGIEQLPSP